MRLLRRSLLRTSPTITGSARAGSKRSRAPIDEGGGESAALVWVLAAGLAVAALALRLPLAASHPQGWDAVDFALALDRYDLETMRPHFPGYPLFVWAGRLARLWVPDPFLALARVSAVSGASAAGVWFLLADRIFRAAVSAVGPTPGKTAAAAPAAFMAAVWVAVSPLAWLSSEQAMSDSLGFLGISLVLLASWNYFRHGGPARALTAGVFLGLVLGVRLSYFPFALTLLALWLCRGGRGWRSGSGGEMFREATGALLGLAAGAAPWLAWQLSYDGPARLVELGARFTMGHLTDWGGSAAAAQAASNRAWLFFWRNWIGLGLGGPAVGGWVGWLVVLLAAGGLWLGWRRLSAAGGAAQSAAPIALFPAAWGLPYFVWAFWGQNPENPRHLLPILPIPIFVSILGWWLGFPDSRGRMAVKPIAAMLGVTALAAAVAWPLIAEHHRTPPPAVELARFFGGQGESVHGEVSGGPLFTWEEERTVAYFAPQVNVRRLRSLAHFRRALLSEPVPPRRIWATSYVLNGFGPQGDEVRGFFREAAVFQGNPLIYTTYHRIVLYEAGPELYDYLRRQ